MKTLDDAADFLSGGTPKKGEAAFWNGDISWFSASNMDRRFLSDAEPKISEMGLKAGSKLAPKGATLLLVRGSGLFNHIPICFADKSIAFNQDVKAICPKDDVDPTFLHFWIETLRKELANNLEVTGIGAGKFDTDFLKALPFPDIAKKRQKEIAFYTETFDRKIELNRRMNETLEGMVQAIFKDWFVDFGPVRRKQEVRSGSAATGAAKMSGTIDPIRIMGGLVTDPAKAKELSELFPVGFGDDGLPVGWELQPLIETLVLQRGFDLPKTKRTDGQYDVIAASGPNGSHNNFMVLGPGVCTGRSGVIGKVYYSHDDFWPLNTSLWIKAFPNSTPIYAYHLLLTLDLSVLNAGSAVPTLNRNHVHDILVPKPPMDVVRAFSLLADKLFAKKHHFEKQNQVLAQTRDYLLPKLMSGEIRVGDAVVETSSKPSNVAPIGGDFFDVQSLSANDNQQRDCVMVAGVVQALQKYDGVVGNVKVQKGCYFVYRLMGLSTRDFAKKAAGPYNTGIARGGYEDARSKQYIRRATKNGYTGNIPSTKIAEIDQLISKYGLGDALIWVKTHLNVNNRDTLELWATVDYAMVALQNRSIAPTVDSVKEYIKNEPNWKDKLNRAAFSDFSIKKAISQLGKLFGCIGTGKSGSGR